MATVGYARVSTTGQSLEVQLDRLSHCEKIFKEQRSGLDGDRPELRACLQYLREGDVLVVTRLDRLARSSLHLAQIAADLEERGIGLRVLDQSIDTTTPTGRLLFSMLADIAQFETELRKERQAEGIAKAKSKGVRFGRQRELTEEAVAAIRRDRDAGKLVREIMEERGLSKASVYRALRVAEGAVKGGWGGPAGPHPTL